MYRPLIKVTSSPTFVQALRSCRIARLLLIAGPLFVAGIPVKANVILQIGRNFTASMYGPDSDALPPDAALAVSSNHVVELINGRFSVFSKTNAALLQSTNDMAFWTNAGLSFGPDISVSDPRLIFDPASQRWFASMIDYNQYNTASNRFLLAVSTTADPTGTWNAVAWIADPVNGNFADFPTLGLDAAGVYLSADMWDSSGDIGPTFVSLPKSDLLAIPPSIDGRTWFGQLNYATNGAIMQPAITLGPTTNAEAVLAIGDLGYDFGLHSTLMASRIQKPWVPDGAIMTNISQLTVPDYLIPPNPLQPNGRRNLDDGDTRLSASVYRVGDVLYAVHSTEVNGLAAIQWFEVDANQLSVLATGVISDSNLDLFYPAIAANSSGAVVIVCNGSSLDTYVSCYAALGEPINGSLAFDHLVLLQPGSASYNNSSSGISRWGDYSCICPDPADPSRFWALTMYPANPGTWATQITELITSPARLFIALARTNVVISWPAAADSFQLQSTMSLSDTNWSMVLQSPVLTNNLLTITLPATNDASFFRLAR
jgi:hypothetical protein